MVTEICFLIVLNVLLWTARRKSHYAILNQLEQEEVAEDATCNSQLALPTNERQRELRPVVKFSKPALSSVRWKVKEISGKLS